MRAPIRKKRCLLTIFHLNNPATYCPSKAAPNTLVTNRIGKNARRSVPAKGIVITRIIANTIAEGYKQNGIKPHKELNQNDLGDLFSSSLLVTGIRSNKSPEIINAIFKTILIKIIRIF